MATTDSTRVSVVYSKTQCGTAWLGTFARRAQAVSVVSALLKLTAQQQKEFSEGSLFLIHKQVPTILRIAETSDLLLRGKDCEMPNPPFMQ